jgi:hypothetical protein
MAEEEVVTTINVKEAKSLTAALKDGTAQRLLYMESIKSDAYPVGELEPAKQRLKGFEWRSAERPSSRDSITSRQMRESERPKYADVKKPLYRQTNKFFDGYMFDLFEQINARKRAELERREREQDSLARAAALAEMPEVSTEAQDASSRPPQAPDGTGIVPMDTLSVRMPLDTTVSVIPDTTTVIPGDTSVIPDTTTVISGDTSVIPGLTGNLKPTETPAIQHETPSVSPDAPVVASPETVVVSEKLTRAEKRALRKAERKARRELRRAARLARRQARRNK